MAKANLAYLSEAVDTAIAAQIQNPLTPVDVAAAVKKGATLRIAGIETRDNSVIEAARAKRLSEFRAQKEAEAALRKRFEDAGVAHIKIIPTKAWNALCARQGLKTVRPRNDGTICVSNDWLSGIDIEAEQALIKIPIYALGAGLLIGIVGGLTVFGVSWYGAFGSLLVGASTSHIASQIAERGSFKEGMPTSTALRLTERRLIKKKLQGDALSVWTMLLPEHTEPKKGVRVGIDLPPAPEDVQQNLIKAMQAGFNLTLHAEPAAMLLRETAPDAFISAREPRYKAQDAKIDEAKRERERQKALRHDPIVTTGDDLVTAIIVQYGEFPFEKQVIDHVLSTEALV